MFLNVVGHRIFFYAFVLLPSLGLLATTRIRPKLHWVLAALLITYLTLPVLWSGATAADQLYFLKCGAFTVCFTCVTAHVTQYWHRYELTFLRLFLFVGGLYGAFIIGVYFGPDQLAQFALDIGVRPYHGETLSGYADGMVRLTFGGNELDNPIYASLAFGLLLLVCIRIYTGVLPTADIILLSVCVPVVLVVLTLAMSKGPIAAVCGTSVILALILTPDKKRIAIPFAVGLALLGILAVAIQDRDTRISLLKDSRLPRAFEVGPRLEIYAQCIKEAGAGPIFGSGLHRHNPVVIDNKTPFNHCHSVFLDTYRATGSIGLIFLSGLTFFLLAQGIGKSRAERFWSCVLLYGLIALNLDGQYPISRPKVFWLVLWFPVGVLLGLREAAGPPTHAVDELPK